MLNRPCVLVAEESVINTLRLAIIGLQKYSDVNRIDVIVPEHQQHLFYERLKFLNVNIIPETDLISSEEIKQIKCKLGVMENRLGWYLQQFLKWEYRHICNSNEYLIWDADTVLVSQNHFFDDKEPIFNMANEYHKPYFNTMGRAFGLSRQVEQSFISQYMLINIGTLNQLIDVCKTDTSQPWFLLLLDHIDKTDPSEFSEYETYGNYVLKQKATNKNNLKKVKWFRYGSDVFTLEANTEFSQLEKKFSSYQYVAFERHPPKLIRSLFANLKCSLRS